MVSLRRLTAPDLDVFREIRLRALTDTPENFGSIAETERAQPDDAWLTRLAEHSWFAAFDGDRPIGLVAGAARGDGWILYSMWVAPEARGRGLAEELVERVRSAAEADGARTLWLHVAEDNEQARRIYLRLGFLPLGEWEPMPNDATRRRERLYLPVT